MKQINHFLCAISLLAVMTSCSNKAENKETLSHTTTYCNPMDLSYRFTINKGFSFREAADPTVVFYKGDYYLFASKTGGYWHSSDLKNWNLVLTDDIPTEEYAPTAVVMRDTLFFIASDKKPNSIYKTANPKSGKWEFVTKLESDAWDPCLFLDDDKKLYFFWGCSDKKPLYGVEMSPTSFKYLTSPTPLIAANPQEYGWEIRGDHNTRKDAVPWIEGAWINKINGKYYLQYAAPGTLEKSYCDAVYIADKPLGPYRLAQHNPFAYKPEGFACGAGHGSTFTDKYGNLWHVGTVTVSVKYKFERRLALFPVFVDNNGEMYMYNRFGDYPIIIPDRKIESPEEVFPEWMLLSYNKKVETSSVLDEHHSENMVDESIRTYWSAQTGSKNEWVILDLDKVCHINSIQLNLAEHNTTAQGRKSGMKNRFTIECSDDKENWHLISDYSQSENDNTHIYIEYPKPIQARYIRINNIEVADGTFAISGLRVFGKSSVEKPQTPHFIKVERNQKDRRDVTLTWKKSENATGYNIRLGAGKNMLYNNYIVYSDTVLTIRSLNANQPYCFSVEAFNEGGISGMSEKCIVK